MNMVEGVILVVCASEGPMPQTRFVLKKALARGLKPIVVVNKVDRDSARCEDVENEVFDLFCNLNASDDQLDYPILFGSAKSGWVVKKLSEPKENIKALLDAIVNVVPSPKVDLTKAFSMLCSQTESNQFFGKMLIGRINSGRVKVGDKITSLDQEGKLVENSKVFKIIRRYGVNQIELDSAVAGDIVSIAGLEKSTVTSTLNASGKNEVIPVNIFI
jgi:GTP-binding protein